MSFTTDARAAQVAWMQTGDLPAAARAPGLYRGRTRDFCLPPEFAVENLLPDARGALTTFAAAQIPWHDSVDGGPSNHCCSSQVQCVNALAPFVDRPDVLRDLFGSILDIEQVLPFGDPVAPEHCVAFEWIGDDDPLGEWVRGVGTRGAHATSADAAIRYRTTSGDEEVALIEWKYTEQYIGKELQSGTNQATRDKRYRHLYEDPAGPVLTDVIPYDDFYVDPVYQLFRLALLAWRFEQAGVASKVRVVYCAPGGNQELWQSLNRPSHRAVADDLLTFWPRLQRRPDRFVSFDTAALVRPGARTSAAFQTRYGHLARS